MRSVILPILALPIGLAAAPPGAGQEAGPAPAEPVPEVRLFAGRCLDCHGPTTTLAFSRKILDAGGTAALDVFLARHHAPDAEARAAIVEFLARTSAARE